MTTEKSRSIGRNEVGFPSSITQHGTLKSLSFYDSWIQVRLIPDFTESILVYVHTWRHLGNYSTHLEVCL